MKIKFKIVKSVFAAFMLGLIIAVPAESGFLFFGKAKTDKEKKADTMAKNLRNKKDSSRGRVADQLIRLDKDRAVKEILDALKAEEDKEIKKVMMGAIGKSGRKDAVPEIKKYLKSEDKEIRLQAASTIAKLGSEEGMGELKIVALNESETRGRRAMAIRSIGRINTDEAVDILEEVLDDEDFAIRLQAVWALGNIGGEKAISLVSSMTSDEDERVRELADAILKRTK